MVSDLFDRLSGDAQSPPTRPKKKDDRPPEDVILEPAQKLLDWLQRWPKDVVYLKDISQRGPRSIRDRKSAIHAAEVLVHHGWLIPQKMRRYDARLWRITRKAVVAPPVAAE